MRPSAKRRVGGDCVDLLRHVEFFQGLNEKALVRLAALFEERPLRREEVLFRQGESSDRLYLVKTGFVDVVVDVSGPGREASHTLVRLGRGQSVGEMSLVDRGPRSATIRAATDDAVVAWAPFEAIDALCQEDARIGYQIMRNIAADLSFRLRHRDQET